MGQEFDEIYKENARIVMKFLLSMTSDYHLAEELTQETFYRAYKNLNSFKGTCKLNVWLCQIAKNLWYKELEKRNKHKFTELDDTMPSNENVEYDCLNKLEMESLKRLILLLLKGYQIQNTQKLFLI